MFSETVKITIYIVSKSTELYKTTISDAIRNENVIKKKKSGARYAFTRCEIMHKQQVLTWLVFGIRMNTKLNEVKFVKITITVCNL